MNYVGSISFIDRGDAPAKAIIDKNVRSLAQRVADETKEELDKVMDRVDKIYVSYEMSTQTMFENPRGSPNVEYIEGIKELEQILTDTVKKKKYQQQVTVFVVGFQDVCAEKMQLLQQVNQFFLDNSKLDEDELVVDKPEIDLEEASNKVAESLNTAEELSKKLSDLNQDIIDWLVNYANTKASNKGKKRLEKSLESAKNELADLSEMLLKLQTELEEKDEKFQQVAKQLDTKTQEVVRYKTAAEVAKKTSQDNEAHTSVLQEEISQRDDKIVELRTKLSHLEINLSETQFDQEMSTRKLNNAQQQSKLFQMVESESMESANSISNKKLDTKSVEKLVTDHEKLAKLQEEVDTHRIAVGDAEREMGKLHKEQLVNLHRSHQQEMEDLKKDHEAEITRLTEYLQSLQEKISVAEQQAYLADTQSEEIRARLFELELLETTEDQLDGSGKSVGEFSGGEEDRQEDIEPVIVPKLDDSRQSNKETKKPTKSLSLGKEKSNRSSKDFADASIQDEGGDASRAYVEKSNEPSRQATRQSKYLEPVVEGDGSEFPNTFDLDDEESWSGVPPQHMAGRFCQFRQMGRTKVKELEEQLQVTLTKTHRKVNSLKSQFTEHKGKWEAERKILIEQVEQAQQLQTDAEKEADAAMTQLEEFINEQEKLEDEEEQKRQEIIKTMSRPGTVKLTTPAPVEGKSATPDAKAEEQAQGDRLQTENSEQELKNLMQQTDDAKSGAGSSLSQSVGEESPCLTPEYLNVKTKKRKLLEEYPKIMGDSLLLIDGLRGERERLQSRTSSKASRKPKIRSSSHLSEKDEDQETDVEGNVTEWSNNPRSPHRRDEEIATVTEANTESRALLPKTKKLHKDKRSEAGRIKSDAHLDKNEKAELKRDLEMKKRKIYEAYKHRMATELTKKRKDIPNETKTVQTEPQCSDFAKEIEDEGHVGKDECTKLQTEKEFEEEDAIPQMKSRTAVQSSVQSRNTPENTRLTLQSLQSVSLAMDMELDDDDNGLNFEGQSHDLNGNGFETQGHHMEARGHVRESQGLEVECQNTRDLMLDSQKHMLTGKRKVHRSGVAKSKDEERRVVSVNVLHNTGDDYRQTNSAEAQKNARQTGAISAPPAVEPDDTHAQKFETQQEDFESKPVTSRQKKSTSCYETTQDRQMPVSLLKEAFRTPRSVRSRSTHSKMSDDSMSIDTDPDEGVAMDLTPSQSYALQNLKSMMVEDNFNSEQKQTLQSLRSAIRSLSSQQALRDIQLERTVTILSLASQIARESVELGVLPDSVFDSFAKMEPRSMSVMSSRRSLKESAMLRILGKSLKPRKDSEEKLATEPYFERDIGCSVVKQKRSKPLKRLRATASHPDALRSLDNWPELKGSKILGIELQDQCRPKSPKIVTKLIKELRDSGSGIADLSSSHGDSCSASLPPSLTSSERRRLSPRDRFSPNTERKLKKQEAASKKEKNNVVKMGLIRRKSVFDLDLNEDDNDGAETKMSSMSIVLSPKKKLRPVTMEQMLYGEGSLDAAPPGLETAMDILNEDTIPWSRSFQRSRPPSEQKRESRREATHGDRPSKGSAHSRKSSHTSSTAPKHSAKSKRSLSLTEPSPHFDLQQPKSPSTLDRVSPVAINRTSPITINRSPRTSATPGTLVSDVQRPVSISSVQPTICETPPPHLHMSHPLHLHKETQTSDMLSLIENEPINGNSDEGVRLSSAKSRASLRNQFKSRLDETRQAVEDRRTNSPVIMVPSQKSVDDELIIEEDDYLPIPDDLKEEALYNDDTLDVGTSPPPGKQGSSRKISLSSRKSTNLAEHAVVHEFLRAYTGIHNFKEVMSRVLVDKDQMSASQILTDLDVVLFNKENKVMPQISAMTENIYYVLNEVSQVINSVLQNDRGPVVSSLMMGMSRDETQRTILRERSGATGDFQPETRGSLRTVSTKVGSASTDTVPYQDIQTQYEKLQNLMSEDSRKYEDQQRHNVVVMMEMQDTINQLQRELSSLGKQSRRPTSETISAAGVQNTDSAIMFTRLDSDRNAKIMKKAVNERKLDPNRYTDALVQMDEYVNLPAQRLAHLVRKYVHHCRMKEIEENVQKSQSLNENVFELFDKMEALQNQRAKRWADRMDEMGIERYRLANMLMETLDGIEQESGLFLIKPMYSYRGREPKENQYTGKITRPFRPHRNLSPLRDSNSAHAPAPTPASNVRPPRNQTKRDDQYPQQNVSQGHYESKGPLEGDNTGLLGSSVGYIGGQPIATWNMADSQPGMHNQMLGNVNTPRILELDINRMMIGQNTISAQIGSQGLSNDRLVNAANNNLRAYMTVNRPGPSSAGRSDRPHSESRPSSSPTNHNLSTPKSTNHSASTPKRVRLSDIEIPTVMSSGPPLPPIGGHSDTPRTGSGKGRQSPPRIPVGNNLPESPPGSSLRHSPPGFEDTEISSPIK